MNRWAPMQHQFGPPKSVLGAFAPGRAELGWPPADSHPGPPGTVVLRLDPLPTGGGGVLRSGSGSDLCLATGGGGAGGPCGAASGPGSPPTHPS